METGSNIQQAIHLVDGSFNKDVSASCTLGLYIDADHLNFHVLDEQQSKYLIFHRQSFEKTYNFYFLKKAVEKVLEQEELLHLDYKHVKISLTNGPSTLIPNKLFDENTVDQYLRFNHTLAPSDAVRVDDLKTIESKHIYTIDKGLLELLQKKLKNPSIYQAVTPLIESLMSDPKVKVQQSIFVNVHLGQMDVLHIDRGKFSFYNSFDYKTPEDFIFHVLFVCEQLNLNPEKIKVVLFGEVKPKSKVYDVLYKYIRHVEFGNRPTAFNYSAAMAELPEHQYYGAFSLNVCA